MLPEDATEDHQIWQKRFRSIVDFEHHLHRNGTRVVKIFLHLSKEEQRQRLLERIDNPLKNWKVELSDIDQRKYWKQYLKAYEDCLAATSTREAPWHIVPADDKKSARLFVSQIIIETLAGLNMSLPELTPQRLEELQAMRKQLQSR